MLKRLFARPVLPPPPPELPPSKVSPGTIIPAAADDVTSEATSDLILMQLETIFAGGIPGTAASMAVGYADAYAPLRAPPPPTLSTEPRAPG